MNPEGAGSTPWAALLARLEKPVHSLGQFGLVPVSGFFVTQGNAQLPWRPRGAYQVPPGSRDFNRPEQGRPMKIRRTQPSAHEHNVGSEAVCGERDQAPDR